MCGMSELENNKYIVVRDNMESTNCTMQLCK